MSQSISLTADADEFQLDFLLGRAVPDKPELRLFANDATPPIPSSAFREVVGGGYAPVLLDPAQWRVARDGERIARTYPPVVFRFTGGVGAVYGYYVVGARTRRVLWAERFPDGPYQVLRAGHEIELTLEVARLRHD